MKYIVESFEWHIREIAYDKSEWSIKGLTPLDKLSAVLEEMELCRRMNAKIVSKLFRKKSRRDREIIETVRIIQISLSDSLGEDLQSR